MTKISVPTKLKKLARAKYDLIKEEQFYSSEETKRYLMNIANSITGRKIKVIVFDDGADGKTAYTDGSEIYINYKSHLITRYTDMKDRWIAFIGLFFHELSHILYQTYQEEEIFVRHLQGGSLYGAIPETEPGKEEMLREFLEAIRNPLYTNLFIRIYHSVFNSLIDKHDEDNIMSKYRGMCPAGIMSCRESLLNSFGLFDDTQELVNKGKEDKLGAYFDVVLQYSRFGEIAIYNNALWLTSDILQKLSACTNAIEIASWTDVPEERWTAINQIIFTVWEYILDFLNEKKSRKSYQVLGTIQGPSAEISVSQNAAPENGEMQESASIIQKSTEELTEDELKQAIQEIQEMLSQAEQKTEPSEPPKNLNNRPVSPKNTAGNISESEKLSLSDKAAEVSKQASLNIMEQIRQSMAQSEAEGQLESEIERESIKAVSSVNQNTTHKGIPLLAAKDQDTSNRDMYERISKETSFYTRQLQKLILNALKEQKAGEKIRHKPYGNMLEVRDTYRPDGLCYSKNKLPGDIPEMAITILVDNSGSMSGNRIETAIRAAVMLYNFAAGLGIPVNVAGHTTAESAVRYTTYAEFDRISVKDGYRICNMHAYDCNRDGMALTIAADILSRRPEEVKLLFIISDGLPNHYIGLAKNQAYRGEVAIKDIQEILRKYRRKGIEIIAAGIGDDRETLIPIYGESYIDIADLKKLPKTAASIVAKRILANIG